MDLIGDMWFDLTGLANEAYRDEGQACRAATQAPSSDFLWYSAAAVPARGPLADLFYQRGNFLSWILHRPRLC